MKKRPAVHSLLLCLISLISPTLYSSPYISLFGVPCSGKTTLARNLSTSFSQKIPILSRDNYADELRRNILELKYGVVCTNSDEIWQAGVMLDLHKTDTSFSKAYARTLQDCKEIFKACVADKKPIIVDGNIIDTLQIPEATNLLVYCPFPQLFEHEYQRSVLKQKRAIVKRVTLWTHMFRVFCRYYQPTDINNEDVIDTFRASQMHSLFDKLVQQLTPDMPQETVEKLKSMITKFKQTFLLNEDEIIAFKQRYAFDVIINSGKHSPEQCCAITLQCIQLRKQKSIQQRQSVAQCLSKLHQYLGSSKYPERCSGYRYPFPG